MNWVSGILLVTVVGGGALFGPEALRDLSEPLHQLCTETYLLGPHNPYVSHIGAAMVCGQRIPSGPLLEELKVLGIYHLVVVSGSHLTWVTLLLSWAQLPGPLHQILLFGLMLTLGFEPPLLRAWFEHQLKEVGPSSQIGAWFLCLAFDPSWWDSKSLALSTVARASLEFGSDWRTKALCLSLAMAPLLSEGWSPWKTLLSFVASGLLEISWFPLLLAAPHGPVLLQNFTESVIALSLRILHEASILVPPSKIIISRGPWNSILYSLAVLVGSFRWSVFRRRRSFASRLR